MAWGTRAYSCALSGQLAEASQVKRALRRSNPNIRALLSSGFSLKGEAQGILDEGVLGFIGKPYRRTELSGIVA